MSTAETRWSIGEVFLFVGIPLFIVALSMDWYDGAGVGYGDIVDGADRRILAQLVGAFGYVACAPGLFVLIEAGGGVERRFQALIIAECLALIGTVIAFAGGLILVSGAPHGGAMEPGFPLFCCAAVCMLVGLLASWPKRAREDGA